MPSFKRRMMMSPKAGIPETGIVEDGLMFHLDGLNRGPAGHWIDRIGGVDYTLNDVVEESNGILFSGSEQSYGICTTDQYYQVLSSTIEVVFEPYKTGSFVLFSPPQSPYTLEDAAITFGATQNLLIYSSKKDGRIAQWNYILKNRTKYTLSMSTQLGYINQTILNTGGVDSWDAQNGTSYLGKRQRSGAAFTGKLFAVRIYNRHLTEADILQNQKHDADVYFHGTASANG